MNISSLGNLTVYCLSICIKIFALVAYFYKSKLLNQTFKSVFYKLCSN